MERLISEVRSASELIKTIVGNVQEIIRSEVHLAKAEVKEEGRKASGAIVFMASAAVLGLFGLFYVLFSIMLLLNRWMPGWSAALAVALLVFAAGGVLFSIGRAKFRKFSAAPQKTIGSVKENVEWFRNQTV